MSVNRADATLIVFVVVIAVDVIGLLIDWRLSAIGWRTITDWVDLCPLLGAPIGGWQFLAPASILAHFYWK